MPLRIDPEQREVRLLRRVGAWRGARVIEIGCGDGRLTRRLARLGARVDALDPEPGLIQTARRAMPASLKARVTLRIGQAERLPQPDETFDLAVFSWVL